MDICFVGLSASGKTTVANFLQGKDVDLKIDIGNHRKLNEIGFFKKVITSTTRNPRENEVNGVDYYFYDKNTFEEMLKEGCFIEHANVFGNLYGTTKKELNRTCSYNRVIVMDPQGMKKIKEINRNVITIFFDISLDNSFSRMKNLRNDDRDEIEKRMKEYEYFTKCKNQCDYIVNANEPIDKVVLEVLNILSANKLKQNKISNK